MMGMIPEPPSPAVKAKVLQLFEGDGIPDCVIDGIARRCGVGSNGKLVYAKPSGEEGFPVLELMALQHSPAVVPYLKGYLLRDAGLEVLTLNMLLLPLLLLPQDSAAVDSPAVMPYLKGYLLRDAGLEALTLNMLLLLLPLPLPLLLLLLPQDSMAVLPYLKGYLLRDAGLEALIRSMMMPSPLLREVAVKGWALGYAECFRVMGVPDDAMLAGAVQAWVGQHPQEPLGLLLQAHIRAVHRGDVWLVQQLEKLAPRMPSPLLRAKVLASAAELQFEQSAMPAALRNAEAALQQMPRHLDMLFFRANCVHSMMGLLDDENDTDTDPTTVTMQEVPGTDFSLPETASAAVHQAFLRYFDAAAAAPQHPHKPAAHFNYALLLLAQPDLRYAARCLAAGVATQTQAAAAKVAATVRSLTAAASNPECVREKVEQRQRTVQRISQLQQERGGGDAAAHAAAGSSNGGSSSSSAAAAAAAAAAAGGSGAADVHADVPAMPLDEQLRCAMLCKLMTAGDVAAVSYKQLHQQLEAQFQMDLSHKIPFLRAILLEQQQEQQQPQQQHRPLSHLGNTSTRSSSSIGRPASPAAAAAAAGDGAESSSCCKVCNARPAKLLRCSRFMAVNYCSAACQTEDWATHKAVCVKKA
uniref:MYND-type domain-containing protein n=1 Tax=Tetradesmus obliquus TaxID=3088 RepID=A0A383V3C9_TETOB|eukprot:jgi/Sobl393_1/2930/SZX59420.1